MKNIFSALFSNGFYDEEFECFYPIAKHQFIELSKEKMNKLKQVLTYLDHLNDPLYRQRIQLIDDKQLTDFAFLQTHIKEVVGKQGCRDSSLLETSSQNGSKDKRSKYPMS